MGSCIRIARVIAAVAVTTFCALQPARVLAGRPPITLQLSEGTSIAAALSPDRKQIVFDLQGVLFKMPAEGGKAVPITDALFDARQPTWSPDGSTIAFQSNRDGHWKIWVIGANGENPRALAADAFDEREPSWSPDGKSIAFTSTRSGKFDIWARTLADGSVRRLSVGPGGNSRASWSPDGSRIAYLSDRPNAAGIYVSDLQGQERQVATIELPLGGPSIAPAGVPTWTPDGKDVLFVKFESAQARLMRGDEVFLEGEDFHPFRMQWLTGREYLYTADGKIKRRSLDGGDAQVVPFIAPLVVRRADYRMKAQDLTASASRPVRGVQRAVLSPDGKQIAFTALGGLWTMNIGGTPRRLTDDGPYAVIDPAWSPDGRRIAFATDRGGSLDIWIMEPASGAMARITQAPGAEIRPAWSPDGKKLVYVDAFGGYQEKVHVRDLASGSDQTLDAAGSSPGYPVWMPDGRSLLVSTYRSQSQTQAYLIGGDNQAAIVPVDGGAARPLILAKGRSIGNRSGDGPVVSPDGKSFVYQLDAALWVQSTTERNGAFEEPRKLAEIITTGQSWSADSRQLLVNAGSIMRIFDMTTGRSRAVPLKLTWRMKKEEGVTTLRAGLLVDGISETARADVDVVIADGRIRSIEPHGTRPPQGRYVDASRLTVMPGLMDTHSHLIKQFGATYGLLNLAYGITTVRSPGNVPGDVLEEKEALASGQRPGPNMFVTGYILDGEQTMWEMGTPVTSVAEVRRQIELASALDYDLIKSYMHTSEPLRAEMVEHAHRAGIPVSGHDIYPAAFMGVDSSEHFFIAGSSRGYSAKVSNLQHVYDDVVQILSKSGMTNAPTLSLFTPSAEFVDHDPAIAKARWALQPVWVRNGPQYSSGDIPGGDVMLANVRASLAKLHAVGARLVVGTDTPLKTTGISTQNELVQMVKAGISPYHALRAATIVPAQMLGVARDLGSVEPGKIADLVLVEGNPLIDIRDASKVRKVMKAGRLYDLEELTRFPIAPGSTTTIANQEVAQVGVAGDLIFPSGIYGTRGTAFEQVDEVTAKIEAMLAANGLKVGDLMRHTIFLKAGAQDPSKVFTRLIGNLRRMGPELTNNPTAGTIVLVPSFPDPNTQIMIEFVGGRAPKGTTRVPIMFGPRMSVESVGNEQFVASFGLEGLDFYGAATDEEIASLKTLDGELAKLVAILSANMAHAGLSIANVVSYNFYVTQGTDPVHATTKLHELMRKGAPDLDEHPSAGTVVVLDGATIPNLKVQLNVIASRSAPATLPRVPIAGTSAYTLAQSVSVPGVVFLSAVDGTDPDKKGAMAANVAGQAEAAARGIGAALRNAGGLKLSNVARFDVYVKHGEDPAAALAAFHKAVRRLDPSFDPKKTAAVVAVVQGFSQASTKFLVSAAAARN